MCNIHRNYKENILHYVPQLNTIDTFRDKSSQVKYLDLAVGHINFDAIEGCPEREGEVAKIFFHL